MLIPDSYRKIEKTKGRSLKEIHSSGVAFSRADILLAFETLKETDAAVLGVDVLRIVDGKLRYTYDSWAVRKKSGENIRQYLARSIAESEAYVRRYPDPEDGTIFYNPGVSELGLP